MKEVKLVEDCLGTTVKEWGRVDLESIDYSDITDRKVVCWIDGLWLVQFYLPDDFFRRDSVEVRLEVREVSDVTVDRKVMEGKTLVFDEEATRSLQMEVVEHLW